MARRRSRSKRSTQTQTQSTVQSSSSTTKRSRRTSYRRRVETDKWVSTRVSELASRMGLDILGLTEEELRVVLTKLVDILRGDANTINADTIVRRFHRNLEAMLSIVASTILELKDELKGDLLEFVINYLGNNVLAYAPRLYREALREKREDLIDRLRSSWSQAWVRIRGPPLPVKCPRCGFDALMPDLTCLVCGSTIDEKELKKSVGFNQLLREFAQIAPLEDVKAALSYGYVYLNSLGIKSPKEPREPLDIEIVLSSDEKELLAEELRRRMGNG